MSRIALAFVFACLAGAAAAAEATVAVAANFLSTAQKLEAAYEARTGHEIVLAHGSTGRLYAQIVQGAPFDVFLAADTDRPARLEAEARTAARRLYAVGRLVLVTRPDGPEMPGGLPGQRIAMADPALAPYGVAAAEALGSLGLGAEDVEILLGDSVGQAASIFATGNAQAAFLSEAQLPDLPAPARAYPMAGRHGPIRQEAVLLSRGAGNPAAAGFFAFLGAPEGRAIIEAAGYEAPAP